MAFEHVTTIENLTNLDYVYGVSSTGSFVGLLGVLQRLPACEHTVPTVMRLVSLYCDTAGTWVERTPIVELRSEAPSSSRFEFFDGESIVGVVRVFLSVDDVTAILLRDPFLTRPLACGWHPNGVRFESRASRKMRSEAPTVPVEIEAPPTEHHGAGSHR